MNKKTNKNRNKFLARLVTSYSFVLIFFLLLGTFTYMSTERNMNGDIEKENLMNLKNEVENFENDIALFSTLVTQVGSNSSVKSLTSMDEVNGKYILTASDVMTYLTEIMSLSSALPATDYYIYLPKTDRLVNSISFSDINRYYVQNKHYDKNTQDTIRDLLVRKDNRYTFIDLNQYKEGADSYLYKLPIYNSFFVPYSPAVVCIEISQNNIRSIFSYIFSKEGGALVVFNKNGEKEFLIEDPANPLKVSEAELIKLCASRSDDSFFFQSGDYFITKITGESGRTFYHIGDARPTLKTLHSARNLYLCVLIAFMIVLLMTIYVISRRNVRPIIEINDQLENSLIQNKTLETELTNQKPYVYTACIAQIMKGQIPKEDSLPELAGYLEISDYINTQYFVLCIKVSEGSEDETDAKRDEILSLKFYEYFGLNIRFYQPDIDTYAILFLRDSLIEPSVVSNDIEEAFNKLHDALLNEFGITVYGGLGKRNGKLDYVWESFQGANEALSYIKEGEYFMRISDFERSSNTYYFPYEIANQLTGFIKAGNATQVTELYHIIRRENYEYRSLPQQTIKWLLSDLRNTLAKIRYTIEENPQNTYVLAQIDKGLCEVKSLEHAQQLSLMLVGLYNAPKDQNPLITSIQAYIQEHVADQELGLKKISGEFDISESYFSFLFKQETGENFSEYLETLRMQKAMDFLTKTDMPLSDLFEATGYNNANSFRRAFKKCYGNSPKYYRDEALGIKPSDDEE